MQFTDFIRQNKHTEKRSKPYIIAEAGVNHEGQMSLAKRLIDEAAEAGADAIKFQSYKAKTLASKHSPAYWDLSKEPTTSQHELFKKYDQFWKSEYEELAKYTDNAGIDFMSTPFDSESVNFLSDLMPAFKIASADITNLPLLKQVAGKNKPILLSTGASTLAEVEGAIAIIQKQSPAIDITLLHCVLNYPTQLENANIGMIRHMVSVFDKFRIGYSDHTLPEHMNTVLASAWLSGAEVIEKHFTHDKSLPGNDHYHAMDKVDLKHFHDHLNHLQLLMGASQKHYLPSEEISRRNARRSIVAKRDIAAGQTITEDDLIAKRPGTGISPTEWYKVIGTTAKTTIQEDDIIQMSQLVNVKS